MSAKLKQDNRRGNLKIGSPHKKRETYLLPTWVVDYGRIDKINCHWSPVDRHHDGRVIDVAAVVQDDMDVLKDGNGGVVAVEVRPAEGLVRLRHPDAFEDGVQ